MEIKVLNTNFELVSIVEGVESIIWREVYDDVGDFEIYDKYSLAIANTLKEDYYLSIPESSKLMVIEESGITTDPEQGDKLIVRGRTLESIIDRRIILRQIQIDASLDYGLEQLITADIINSIYPERNIPNFIYVPNTTDITIASKALKGQYYSENLLETVVKICQEKGVGFRLLLNETNHFAFSLYTGKDRSFGQGVNDFVIFSPDNDNLVSSSYYETKRYQKNYVLVSGNAPSASPGNPYRQQVWNDDVGTGLNRREMFADATDLPLYVLNTNNEISQEDYLLQLTQRGKEELAANSKLKLFDGQIRVNLSGQTYNSAFFLGDIVQMVDNYGHGLPAQIKAMTISENLNGKSYYPTMKTY